MHIAAQPNPALVRTRGKRLYSIHRVVETTRTLGIEVKKFHISVDAVRAPRLAAR